MKKLNQIILTCILSISFNSKIVGQQIIKTEKESYTIEGAYNFMIVKTDNVSKKVIYKAATKIPDKSQKEMYYPGANNSSFTLIGDNIFIVYDVWQKSTGTKDCSIKLFNTKANTFKEPILVYTTKVNSVYSSNEVIYKTIYSPDKSKLIILKDNISPSYNIDPEITYFDTKTLKILATKKISGKYNNVKRVFDQNQISLDNTGNIALVFHLLNEQTKITTKSYTADIPFNEPDLKNIKELTGNNSSDNVVDQKSHGRFYKTLQDYVDEKPMAGVRIKNGSFHWSLITGTDFKLIDDEGNLTREGTKDMPSDLFTYKRDNYSAPYIIRLIDKKPYIVLAAGKLNYYSLYQEQQQRYYMEGWDGKLKKFKEKDLEEFLEKYGLLENYKKDKPKREFKDDVNGYFNKIIAWQIDYFNKLNKKM